MPLLGIVGDDDGSLRLTIEEVQRTGVVAEGFRLVGISTSMLGCGAGHPPPEHQPNDPVCSGSPWRPHSQELHEDE